MSEHINGDILPIELMAKRENWSDGISVYMRRIIFGISQEVAQPIVFKSQELKQYVVEPAFRLEITAAQQLMDELWKCGLRPSEGTGSAGAMAAVQKHLEDMRSLVFKIKK